MCPHNTFKNGLACKLRGVRHAVFVCVFYLPFHLIAWSTWTGNSTNEFLLLSSNAVVFSTAPGNAYYPSQHHLYFSSPNTYIYGPVQTVGTNFVLLKEDGSLLGETVNQYYPGATTLWGMQMFGVTNGALQNYGFQTLYELNNNSNFSGSLSWAYVDTVTSELDSGVVMATNVAPGLVDSTGVSQPYNNDYMGSPVGTPGFYPSAGSPTFPLGNVNSNNFYLFDVTFTRSLIWGECGENIGWLGSNCVGATLYLRMSTNQPFQQVYTFPYYYVTNYVVTEFGNQPCNCIADPLYLATNAYNYDQCFYPATNNYFSYVGLGTNFLTVAVQLSFTNTLPVNIFSGIQFEEVNQWNYDIGTPYSVVSIGNTTNLIQPDIEDFWITSFVTLYTNGLAELMQFPPFYLGSDISSLTNSYGE